MNKAEAADWFGKAAEQGHAEAQFDLGEMYGTGDGVPKNETEAVNLYRKAAEGGYAGAQTELGSQLEGSNNHAEAAHWYRKAAEQGDPSAQLYLGHMYMSGMGVARDHVEAYKWYVLSGSLHDPEEERVRALLTPSELEEAERAVQDARLHKGALTSGSSTDAEAT